MIQRLFKQLTLHTFGSTFNYSCIVLDIFNCTKISCQLPCNYLSLLTFFKVYNSSYFLIFHLFKSLPILCKRCHLCRKYRALLNFLQFIKSKVKNNKPTFLDMDSGGVGDINVSERVLVFKELFSRPHVLRVMGSGINKLFENFFFFLLDGFFIG